MKCNVCDRECKNNNSLAIHVIKKHNISIQKYYDDYTKTDEDGICLHCKKETKFINLKNGYRKFCCNQCSQTYQSLDIKMKSAKIQTMENTKLNRYGDKHYSNLESSRKTNIKKYGVKNPFQVEKFKEKTKKTWLKKYGYDHPIKWMKERLSNNEWHEKYKRLSKKGRDALKNNFNKPTSLEKKYYSLLKDEKIKFEPQYELEGRWFDAYLPAYNTLLEFDGDFWHKESLNECQYDFQRKSYYVDQLKTKLAKKYGMKLIRIKESNPVSSIKNLL